jgi:hypothetical protein
MNRIDPITLKGSILAGLKDLRSNYLTEVVRLLRRSSSACWRARREELAGGDDTPGPHQQRTRKWMRLGLGHSSGLGVAFLLSEPPTWRGCWAAQPRVSAGERRARDSNPG